MRTRDHLASDMDVSDLEAAFALPLAEDTSVDTTLLGVVSTLASLATPLAGILLAGYVVRLVRAGDREAAALPSFDDLTGMAVDGARLSAALVALQLPAVGLATVSLPGSRPSIAMLSYATNPVMLGSFGVTALDTAGLVAAGLASLLGSYLSLVATVALAREASLAAAIPATRDLASDRSFVRVASAVALVVFVARLFVALCAAVPVAGTLLAATASFLLLVVSATLLGRGAPDASSPGADATRESHADGVNAESVESAESVPSA
ncbi:DUF4013 domain-containing protein [Haloferax volcanii]|nr:DUF4013 domain-containing protein [Haloferax volcanii]MBS8119770.1 DUF4013 domain-containing protein [Haloferax volcanii]MBS8124782.1 DUF4013 domain-containing protein [Haloferax volcanii]MBS8128845.1 DUF4013 domain-containing protein [Haloferax volcanii]MBS8132709.1 DUF4013 domain-containing protein [Haloferax volcanii]MDW7535771.1 DUF4013 domain-containing protein [Haloferax volcanii]